MVIATVEANPAGFCMALSCLVDTWKYSQRLSPSFSERFGSLISMPQLNKGKALELTKAYLDYGRTKKNGLLDPFTEDSIEKLLAISGYNHREFLHNNSILLNELIVDESSEKIDQNFINKNMKSIKVQKE
jgi:hypothetical protein